MRLHRRELSEAANELDAAVDWYANIRTQLAVEFLSAVEAGAAHVLEWPDSGRPYPGQDGRHPPVRTKRIKGFPYSIVYLVDDEALVIVAYTHHKQLPGYWQQRLNE